MIQQVKTDFARYSLIELCAMRDELVQYWEESALEEGARLDSALSAIVGPEYKKQRAMYLNVIGTPLLLELTQRMHDYILARVAVYPDELEQQPSS